MFIQFSNADIKEGEPTYSNSGLNAASIGYCYPGHRRYDRISPIATVAPNNALAISLSRYRSISGFKLSLVALYSHERQKFMYDTFGTFQRNLFYQAYYLVGGINLIRKYPEKFALLLDFIAGREFGTYHIKGDKTQWASMLKPSSPESRWLSGIGITMQFKLAKFHWLCLSSSTSFSELLVSRQYLITQPAPWKFTAQYEYKF